MERDGVAYRKRSSKILTSTVCRLSLFIYFDMFL
jgi:hypothetical protein